MANASSLTFSTVPQFQRPTRRRSAVSLPASAAFSRTPPSLRSTRSQPLSALVRHRCVMNGGVKRRTSCRAVSGLHDYWKGGSFMRGREGLCCFRGNGRKGLSNFTRLRAGAYSPFALKSGSFGNTISGLSRGGRATQSHVLCASTGPEEPHVASQTWSDTLVDKPYLDGEDKQRVDLDEVLDYQLPSHPKLHRGQLNNGLRYIILPNKNPADRFEAHMEVHVGSIDEEEDEQGIAHMIEHVTFLGSKKREKLLGTGARSNAYTDFHHTVFHIHSPTHAKDTGEDLLPSVLDALNEIAFHPKFLASRVEKERKAILSELQMMNTIEYRIDCQLLQHLHGENKLSKRFPIGLEEQIKMWDPDMVRRFHERWYYPANATLYLVGDIPDISNAVHHIQQTFSFSEKDKTTSPSSPTSPLPPLAMASFLVNKFSGGLTTKQQQPSPAPAPAPKQERQPVHHLWSLPESTHAPKPPQIFQHELVSAFSINMFAKVPVNKVHTYRDLRDVLMKRIFLSALHFRINTRYKSSNPPFQSIELDHSDSGREGCTVTTLTVTAEPKSWHNAVKVAVHEVRRLKEFGLTKGEMTRYMDALIKDSEQMASMIDNIPSVDNLDFIMESDALGHTVMDQRQGHESLLAVAETVTLEEVNAVGAQVLEFISNYSQPSAPPPTAIVACVPKKLEIGDSISDFIITSQEITDAINEGLQQPIYPEPELEVPKELLTPTQLQELRAQRGSSFVPLSAQDNSLKLFDKETGIVQRRLSNGISVNYKITPFEKRVGVMRLIVCGGRATEVGDSKGGVIVGVRALSEGGCVGNFSREQVELFCVNNLVNCSLECTEECIFMEFRFSLRDNGMRAAFQLLHMVLEQNVWLEDAFERSRQLFLSFYRSIPKSLERSVAHKLMKAMLNGDQRFVEPTPDALQKLTLQSVKDAVMSHFVGDNMELSIVGDFTEDEIESCILDYLGTVSASPPNASSSVIDVKEPFVFRPYPSDVHFQEIRIKDTDERACAYLAGPAPNRWGFTHDGRDLFQCIDALALDNSSLSSSPSGVVSLRKHPLFFGVTLGLLAEIINSRLFTTVRDSLGLTYDVSFEVNLFDKLSLGWYVVSVTSTPEKVHKAVDACKGVLRSLNHNKITQRELDRAKRTLLMKHVQDSESNNVYWLALMTHLQAKSVPRKDVSCIRELSALYEGATIDDIYLAYDHLGVDESFLFSCIGISGTQTQPDDDLPALDENIEMGHHGMAPTGGRGLSTMTRPTT